MSVAYPQMNKYLNANLILSETPQAAPENMTTVPGIDKLQLVPKLYTGTTSLQLDGTKPATQGFSLVETDTSKNIRTPQVAPDLSEINVKSTSGQMSNLLSDKDFQIFRKLRGRDSDNIEDIKKDWEDYIENAAYAIVGSAAFKAVGSIMDAVSQRDYRKQVEATKTQYEAQKKIIDTNINNTESGLMENLMENMANLDATMAAKNVDLTSESIAGDKAKGAMDLGKDISQMRTQGALQKAALDLEYAMNVKAAKKAEINSYVNTALQIGGAALSLL